MARCPSHLLGCPGIYSRRSRGASFPNFGGGGDYFLGAFPYSILGSGKTAVFRPGCFRVTRCVPQVIFPNINFFPPFRERVPLVAPFSPVIIVSPKKFWWRAPIDARRFPTPVGFAGWTWFDKPFPSRGGEFSVWRGCVPKCRISPLRRPKFLLPLPRAFDREGFFRTPPVILEPLPKIPHFAQPSHLG